jgi:hypothetical protein
MEMMKTTEHTKRENARRQREFRARQRKRRANLETIANKVDLLEDVIKLCASCGDELAQRIVDHVSRIS